MNKIKTYLCHTISATSCPGSHEPLQTTVNFLCLLYSENPKPFSYQELSLDILATSRISLHLQNLSGGNRVQRLLSDLPLDK